jgi:phosphate transport system protein
MHQIAFNTHISAKYNAELENLRHSVMTMGGAIEKQMVDTIRSIRENHCALAEQVIMNDIKINSMEIQIDEECMRIIATRHPTASDLRLVMTVSKTTADIERMGDEIERIAKLVTRDKLPESQELKSSMANIGDRVVDMMRGTLDAFARQDDASALDVYESDNVIDAEYKKLLSRIAEEMQRAPGDMQNWLDLLWAMRSLERIGDRCKNICEYVVYLTRGKDVRHLPMESLQEKMKGTGE